MLINVLVFIFLAGKLTAPCLGGGRGTCRESRQKSEMINLDNIDLEFPSLLVQEPETCKKVIQHTEAQYTDKLLACCLASLTTLATAVAI